MQRRTGGRRRFRFGLSRVDVLVVICLLGLLFAMLMPATRSTRGTARRMECQSNLKNLALATTNYASANGGRLPFLEDGQFSWPVALMPYLDQAALWRTLQADPAVIENEWERSRTPLHLKVLTCPVDVFNAGQHVGLSYVANAGWGRFLADPKTDAIREAHPHSAEVDWDRDGSVSEHERRLTRATGVFWRVHEDGFQLTLDNVAEGDGQGSTILLTENTNARNWLSRETFDIGFVVGLNSTEAACVVGPLTCAKLTPHRHLERCFR
ncbi:MAG: hypothetical protein FD138_3221 [Planctomycetota bacterium]|nr:MAG: hypothetical protein FD138_3221 [Planctomycetota bacterium]